MVNKLSRIVVGLLSLSVTWAMSQSALAATTYPIDAVEVMTPRTYLTASQTGKGYQLTIWQHQRAHLRVNLHLKNHPNTVWTRQEQAYITRAGKRRLYYYVKDAAQQSGWVQARDLKATPPAAVHLTVPLISQRPELPTGCEMTATAMLLQYAGHPLDKMAVAAQVPRSHDPNLGFVGDPTSDTGVGLYVYPRGLLSTVQRYLPTAKDMSGMSLVQLKAQLVAKRPVVTWMTGLDGFASHTITVTGYTPEQILYNDPWTGMVGEASNQDFERMWAQNGRRALSY